MIVAAKPATVRPNKKRFPRVLKHREPDQTERTRPMSILYSRTASNAKQAIQVAIAASPGARSGSVRAEFKRGDLVLVIDPKHSDFERTGRVMAKFRGTDTYDVGFSDLPGLGHGFIMAGADLVRVDR